ncbi:MAG TPA: MlaD family protein [Ottowia sp.]|uniref:MlaD family protein n=1 Tax=Ottowia sp. TaxID=1898956 RepID=UPI002CE69B8C|nr:MlaD family protein [Ottowia sp.]HMN19998.1 MlaD family protein [Ottowia sp.]
MENKSHALAAGLFVLAISALLVLLALWLMRDSTNTTPYRMTSADGVTGLQVQAAVRYKGVAVGKVTGIGFDPAQRGNVLVSIAVRSDAPITRSTFATLAFQGVTGLSFIQLDDSGSSTEPPAVGPDGVPRIPLRPNVFGQLSDQAGALLEKVDQAVDGVNRLLGAENQGLLTATLNEMQGAARSFSELARDTNRTIEAQFGPRRSSIPQLVQQATATFRTLDGVGAETNRALADVRAVTAELARGLATLTGEGGVVARLDEGATTVTQTTLPRIQNLTEEASRTIRRLDRIANTLGENPQALLYGSGPIPPGPGEPGFVAPDARAAPTE